MARGPRSAATEKASARRATPQAGESGRPTILAQSESGGGDDGFAGRTFHVPVSRVVFDEVRFEMDRPAFEFANVTATPVLNLHRPDAPCRARRAGRASSRQDLTGRRAAHAARPCRCRLS